MAFLGPRDFPDGAWIYAPVKELGVWTRRHSLSFTLRKKLAYRETNLSDDATSERTGI
jgi:hypothetical protein